MKLTKNEIEALKDAIKIAEKSASDLKEVLELAEEGTDINPSLLWDMKNYTNQISAVLYNIHHEVYRPKLGVRQ